MRTSFDKLREHFGRTRSASAGRSPEVALRRSESILSGAPVNFDGYAAFASRRIAAASIWCPCGAHYRKPSTANALLTPKLSDAAAVSGS